MAKLSGTIVGFLIIVFIMALLGVLPLWLGWNFGPAEAFNWPRVSFMQALASSFMLAMLGSYFKERP